MAFYIITKNARLCLTGKTALWVRPLRRTCFVAKDSRYVYTASSFAPRICGILTSSRIQVPLILNPIFNNYFQPDPAITTPTLLNRVSNRRHRREVRLFPYYIAQSH